MVRCVDSSKVSCARVKLTLIHSPRLHPRQLCLHSVLYGHLDQFCVSFPTFYTRDIHTYHYIPSPSSAMDKFRPSEFTPHILQGSEFAYYEELEDDGVDDHSDEDLWIGLRSRF